MKLNKKVIIVCIVILIAAISAGIYFYKRNNNNISNDSTDNSIANSIDGNNIKETSYIDIWFHTETDIALYSGPKGRYLGNSPLHYLINKDGDIYTYKGGSFQDEKTGEIEPATVEYIKKLSQDELESLVNDLKSIIKNDNSNDTTNYWTSYWNVEIDGNTNKVYESVKTNVLDKYL